MLARRHTAAELVAYDDRPALLALLDEARRCAAAGQPTETYVRIAHVSGDGARMQPVELKACTDGGDHIYCVFLDARVPARLESVLPQARTAKSQPLLRLHENALTHTPLRGSRSFSCPQVRRRSTVLRRCNKAKQACALTLQPVHLPTATGHDLRTPCFSIQARRGARAVFLVLRFTAPAAKPSRCSL